MTLEIRVHCDGCDGELCDPVSVKGGPKKRTAAFKQMGWGIIDEKSEKHIGPRCSVIVNNLTDIGMKLINITMDIDNSSKAYSGEIVGSEDHEMAHKSRYCNVAYRTRDSQMKHEYDYHQKQYVRDGPPSHRTKQVRIDHIVGRGQSHRLDEHCESYRGKNE